MVAINMEMPKNCIFCPLYVGKKGEGHCAITHKWNAVGGLNRLDDCPLVEIEERKQGEWILHEENSASSSYHCSVCNRLINVLWSEELSDYPYCHCGAKMRGSENG